MNKFLSIFLLLFMIMSTGLIAQNGSIRGNVFDKETGEPSFSIQSSEY